uniref:Uncharacterized protein n=1 Tax=Haptolina ericina TaxID=156174 RepID=A0A7S3EPF6_9EUKA
MTTSQTFTGERAHSNRIPESMLMVGGRLFVLLKALESQTQITMRNELARNIRNCEMLMMVPDGISHVWVLLILKKNANAIACKRFANRITSLKRCSQQILVASQCSTILTHVFEKHPSVENEMCCHCSLTCPFAGIRQDSVIAHLLWQSFCRGSARERATSKFAA